MAGETEVNSCARPKAQALVTETVSFTDWQVFRYVCEQWQMCE